MSGCVTRTTSPRPSFQREMNGGQTGDQNQACGSARDPDAAPFGRAHVVVRQHERSAVGTGAAGGTPRRVDVLAAGDDDDVIEDHVPDNDSPRDPQRPGEANLGPRPHTSNYRRKYIAIASSASRTSTVTRSGVRLERSC